MKNNTNITEEEFVGNFLQKSRRIKSHNLPYGMDYLNLLAEVEMDAKRKYKSYIKKQKK